MKGTKISTRTEDPPPYKPLDSGRREIRLIQFDHPYDAASEEINTVELTCRVDVYRLDDLTREYLDFDTQAPSVYSGARKLQEWKSSRHEAYPARFQWGDYIAMSHTWGERSRSHRICVNGQIVQVSENLVKGLKALSSYPAVLNGKLKVWNDFLCLDQQNKLEVQRELKNMSTIFSDAYEVVAWIGPALDNDALTMVFLEQLGTENDSNMELESRIHAMPTETWAALAYFCQREYWRRMWVVQELTMAGPQTVLLCGKVSAPLRALWTLATVVVHNAPTFHRLFAASVGDEDAYYSDLRHNTFSVCCRLLYLKGIDETVQKQGPCDILRLLDICRGSLQHDDRDKVYGILGLLSSDVTNLIIPDLRRPTHAVYTDLARAIIRGTMRLDLLQNCRLDKIQPGFPSWTPDLLHRSMSHILGTRALVDAGGDFDVKPTFSADGRFLQCQGIIIDEIDHLTPPQWPLVDVSPEEIKQTIPKKTFLPKDQSELGNLLWKTLVGGSAGGNFDSPAPEEFARILEFPWPELQKGNTIHDVAEMMIAEGWCSHHEKQDLTTLLLFLHRAQQDFDIAGYPLHDFFQPPVYSTTTSKTNPSDSVTKSPSATVNRALRQASNTMKRRRLSVTNEGRLAAVVRQAKPGDHIVVLRGCSTPVILRSSVSLQSASGPGNSESVNTFMVVGDCYVHGIMNGEALLGAEKLRDIILC